jgi:hypothetical protein
MGRKRDCRRSQEGRCPFRNCPLRELVGGKRAHGVLNNGLGGSQIPGEKIYSGNMGGNAERVIRMEQEEGRLLPVGTGGDEQVQELSGEVLCQDQNQKEKQNNGNIPHRILFSDLASGGSFIDRKDGYNRLE